MDSIELQAEAVKQGCTLVNQNDFYLMGRVVDCAKEHVNAVHTIMAAYAFGATTDEILKLRRLETEAQAELVAAIVAIDEYRESPREQTTSNA